MRRLLRWAWCRYRAHQSARRRHYLASQRVPTVRDYGERRYAEAVAAPRPVRTVEQIRASSYDHDDPRVRAVRSNPNVNRRPWLLAISDADLIDWFDGHGVEDGHQAVRQCLYSRPGD